MYPRYTLQRILTPYQRYVNLDISSPQFRLISSIGQCASRRCYHLVYRANVSSTAASMKRSAPSPTKSSPKAKKPRPEVPEYHSTPPMRDEAGEIIWPAPSAQIAVARNFIKDW